MIDQRVGSYKIVRQIGEGGMSVVFEAVHEQLPDGSAFIIMEYLNGESLKTRLKRLGGRLGPDVLRITRQIASALLAAHSHNIVHRDLKPDNVMIVADPETPGGERIKVLDFGIAKLAMPDDDASFKTRTGMMMGTPAYMSPEQCRGAGSVDTRSDVYSLGVMLYQFLTGRLPFVAGGSGEVIGMHIFATPPPIRDVEPGVSPAMAELVHAMLAKQPAERPDMAQAVAALEKMDANRAEPSIQISASQISALALVERAGLSSPTTLGQAAVETQAQTGVLLGGRKPTSRGVLGTAVLGILLVAGGGALLWRKVSSPVAGGLAPAVKTVRWAVATDPADAEVVQQLDGRVLGHTPWERAQEARTGTLLIVLKKPGFVDKSLTLSYDVDARINEKLAASAGQLAPAPNGAPAALPAPAGTEHRHKTKGSAKKNKGNQEPFGHPSVGEWREVFTLTAAMIAAQHVDGKDSLEQRRPVQAVNSAARLIGDGRSGGYAQKVGRGPPATAWPVCRQSFGPD